MSTTSAPLPLVDLVKEWDTEQLIDFMRKQNLKLKEKNFTILQEQEVTGLAFLELSQEALERWKMPGGPATTIAKLAKDIKGEDQGK